MIWLAGPNNQPLLVPDQDLADALLRALRRDGDDHVRLVFLSSCQSATRSPSDAFRGLAPKLVQAGVPAVLAMQDLAPIETARAFSQVFYRQLLQHGLGGPGGQPSARPAVDQPFARGSHPRAVHAPRRRPAADARPRTPRHRGNGVR